MLDITIESIKYIGRNILTILLIVWVFSIIMTIIVKYNIKFPEDKTEKYDQIAVYEKFGNLREGQQNLSDNAKQENKTREMIAKKKREDEKKKIAEQEKKVVEQKKKKRKEDKEKSLQEAERIKREIANTKPGKAHKVLKKSAVKSAQEKKLTGNMCKEDNEVYDPASRKVIGKGPKAACKYIASVSGKTGCLSLPCCAWAHNKNYPKKNKKMKDKGKCVQADEDGSPELDKDEKGLNWDGYYYMTKKYKKLNNV